MNGREIVILKMLDSSGDSGLRDLQMTNDSGSKMDRYRVYDMLDSLQTQGLVTSSLGKDQPHFHMENVVYKITDLGRVVLSKMERYRKK